MEEDKNSPYSSLPPPSSSSSSSVSLSPSPSALAPLSLSRYGNGARGVQQEVNNNSGVYGGSAAPPAGKSSGFIGSRPGPQDFNPYRGPGPYSALKGPSGRYLSRSIPVSPDTAAARPRPSLLIGCLCSDIITLWPHICNLICGSLSVTSTLKFHVQVLLLLLLLLLLLSDLSHHQFLSFNWLMIRTFQ